MHDLIQRTCMNKNVIIVAGGKGLRMGNDIPKQFLLLGGKPVLMHTLEIFHHTDATLDIILVLPYEQQAYWQHLCKQYTFNVPHKIAPGGETRFHSVKNGLEMISGNGGLIAIHDGVRPFVSKEVIEESFEKAKQYNAIIPIVDVVETIREIQGNESQTVNREKYKLVQTPQVFNLDLLQKAYSQPYSDSFTDDASVVEAFGEKVHLIQGNRENIKITTPFDLLIGESIVHSRKK